MFAHLMWRTAGSTNRDRCNARIERGMPECAGTVQAMASTGRFSRCSLSRMIVPVAGSNHSGIDPRVSLASAMTLLEYQCASWAVHWMDQGELFSITSGVLNRDAVPVCTSMDLSSTAATLCE